MKGAGKVSNSKKKPPTAQKITYADNGVYCIVYYDVRICIFFFFFHSY